MPPKPPSPPLLGSDGPIELDDSELMEVSEGPDLVSLDDMPTPVPGQGPPAPPGLALPADDLLELPTPLPADPGGLRDPAAPSATSDAGLDLADLPAPSPRSYTFSNNLPAPAAPSYAPEGAGLSDLPTAIDLSDQAPTQTPSLMDDLPVEAPELSAADDAAAQGLGLFAASAVPGQDGDLAAPAAHVLDEVRPEAPAEGGAAAAPAPRAKGGRRTLVWAVGAVATLVAAGVGAALVWGPGLAALSKHGHAPGPAVAPKVAAKAPAVAAAGPAAAAPSVPPPPPPPPLEALTRRNVDTLDYAALKAGLAVLQHDTDKESHGLALWARFRLATAFDDAAVRAELPKSLSERADPTPLGAVAQIGVQLLVGKPAQAKHALERLRGPLAKTPQGLFVATWAAAKKHAPKALAQAEKALSDAPELVDLQLLRAELLMGRKEHSESTRLLIELSRNGAPGTVARAALLLAKAEELTALDEALGNLKDLHSLATAAPAHREALWRLWVRKKLRAGDLKGALELASARAQDNPENAAAAVELARLTLAKGGDPFAILAEARAKMTDAEGKARLLWEQVRLGLQQKADPQVQQALKEAVTLPPHAARGWMKMAEALVAEHDGQMAAAKQDYLEASRWRPTFEEPRLALALAEPLKPPQELALLTKMAHKSQLPELHWRLALALEAKPDYAAAARELERVSWYDPTLTDPVDLVLHWISLLDRAGEALRAETLAEALSTARPDDDRPPLLIVEMALRGKRYDTAIKWYQTLLTRHPNHRVYTVGLANVYTDAGKAPEAQKLLEAQLKADPQALDDAFLMAQARAWGQQEVVRARGYLLEAIKRHPQPKAYILLAELEQGRGKTDEAMQAYRDAVQLDPTLWTIRLRLARNLIQKGFTKEAIAALEDILRRNPQEAEAAEVLGDALREQGQAKEAVAAYTKALLMQPNAAPLLMKVARLELHELNQTKEAVATLKRAAKADPHNSEAQYYLGYALRDLGKAGDAKLALQRYLQLAPAGEFAQEVRQDLADMQKR